MQLIAARLIRALDCFFKGRLTNPCKLLVSASFLLSYLKIGSSLSTRFCFNWKSQTPDDVHRSPYMKGIGMNLNSRRMMTTAVLLITLILPVLPCSASTSFRRYVLINAEFVVRPSQFRSVRFHVGSNGGDVVGRFRSDTNIEVYIMDDDALDNWRNGARVNTYYSSGRLTVANINVRLGEGDYNLVFSNTYSTFSIKEVKAYVELRD
jgi:hypothetical protein